MWHVLHIKFSTSITSLHVCHNDVQHSMYLHTFAYICTYTAKTKYLNKQMSIENICI